MSSFLLDRPLRTPSSPNADPDECSNSLARLGTDDPDYLPITPPSFVPPTAAPLGSPSTHQPNYDVYQAYQNYQNYQNYQHFQNFQAYYYQNYHQHQGHPPHHQVPQGRHTPFQEASPRSSPAVDSSVIPWSTAEGETTYIRPSAEFANGRRLSAKSGNMQVPPPGRRSSVASSFRTHSSSSTSASATSAPSFIMQSPRPHYSPFPAPSKPLPAVPGTSPMSVHSHQVSSQLSMSDKSSFVDMDRFSQSSSSAGAATNSSEASRSSLNSMLARQYIPQGTHLRPGQASNVDRLPPPRSAIDLMFSKQLAGTEKRKGNASTIFHADMSMSSATVATRHGNNILKFWSVATGTPMATIKVPSYIEARGRSRDYIIRSHTILSESAQLAAIATHFGRTIEIWNFTKPKRLQTIEDADRWAAGRFETHDSGWTALAAFRTRDSVIDLFAATTRDKKPFVKVRTIDLRKAGLPLLPQFPELAISPTSPMLVAASGPRTPRAHHPPPDREVLLVAWDISDYRDVSSQPYRVIRPWQHRELETALPVELTVYGDIIVSMWIPAGQRTIVKTKPNGDFDYTLAPNPVPFRYILVWDVSENSTRTYGIPNTTSCISPDCRFVAYCQIADKLSKLAILDAQSGDELWSVGGEGSQSSLQGFEDLDKITELSFAPNGRHLIIGDSNGNTSLFDVADAIE